MRNLRWLYSVVLLAVWLGIFAVEVLAVRWRAAGRVGTVLWFVSYSFFILFALRSIVPMIRNLRSGYIITPLTIGLWVIMLTINIPQVRNVSFEATQPAAQVLRLFDYAADWGFRGQCHLGYIARQYFLPAVPSLVLGRTVTALNLGNSLYFFLGVLIFSSGVLACFRSRRTGDLIGGILLVLFAHVYYVNFFLFWFEHTIFPFCFSLILTGLVLHYMQERASYLLVLIGLCVQYLIFAYPPGLALVGLAIIFLAYWGALKAQTTGEKILIAGVIAISIISFYLSIPDRNDIAVTGRIAVSGSDYVWTKSASLARYLLLQASGPAIVSPFFYFGFLFGVVSPLFFLYGWELAVLSVWIVAVIWVSVLPKGYCWAPLELVIQRATVVFPVLLAMVIRMIQPILSESRRRYCFGLVLWLFLISTGFLYQARCLEGKEDRGRIRIVVLTHWIRAHIEHPESGGQLFFDPQLGVQFAPFYDAQQYFLPTWQRSTTRLDIREMERKPENQIGLLVVPRGRLLADPGYSKVRDKMKWRGEYQFRDERPLDIYQF